MKKKLVILVATAFIFTMIAGCGSSNDTVATVAGEKVTTAEFQFLLANIKTNMEKQQNLTDATAVQNFWATMKVEGKSIQDVAKEQALDNAKVLKIHLIKAKQSNMVLDTKDLSDAKSQVDSIMSSIDGYVKQSQDKTLTDDKVLLQEYGVNQQQLQEISKEFVLQSKYVQAQEAKINVTEDQIKKQYDDNKDNYDKVTVQHILFSTVDANNQPLSQDKIDAAKKNADDILARVNKGEDFAALAKQYSEDPGSKDKGGEYTFGKGEMVAEFENWAFSAKPGDTGVVKSSYGYHVMKFEKRTTYDDVKDAVKTDLLQSEYAKQLDALKKDPQYNVTTTKLYDSIKVVQ